MTKTSPEKLLADLLNAYEAGDSAGTDALMAEARKHLEPSPRFVWNIGSIREEFPDMPEQYDCGTVVLYDRKHRRAVATVTKLYAQLFCLQTTKERAPLDGLANWLNTLPPGALKSEGLPT